MRSIPMESFRQVEAESGQVICDNDAISEQIVTADENEVCFALEAIEDDALLGSDSRILIDDIRVMSIKLSAQTSQQRSWARR